MIQIAGVVAVIVAANLWLFSGRLTNWISSSGRLVALVSGATARARAFVGVFATRSDLARENILLQTRINELQGQLTDTDALTRELAVARATVGLTAKVSTTLTEAGIVAWPRDGGVSELTIDRGSNDGIAVDDVATSPDGALIGVVREVESHRATLTELGDPALEVAGIVGSGVSGLVRTDAKSGLILDLVRQGETVHEGEIIATSGNDGLPAGLVIGTVRSVELPAASLFSLVRITPAVSGESVGRVIIIRP